MHRKRISRGLVFLSLVLVAASPKQTFSQSGLVAALQTKYQITQATFDRSQISSPGIVMDVVANGINAQPGETFLALENKVVDGKVQQPSRMMQMMLSKSNPNMSFLSPGDKVYITKIETKSDTKGDYLKFSILTCDPQDLKDGSGQKRLSAVLDFKLPKDSLAQISPDEVEHTVEAVLAPDANQGDAGQGGTQAASAPAPAPAPAPGPAPAPAQDAAAGSTAPPQTISLGQTPAQVVAIMGQPQQVIDLGKKKTYIYKDLKVVFVGGQVSDVQ